MITLSLVHWLLLGNLSMMFIVGGLMWSLRRQQLHDGSQYQTQIAALKQAHSAVSKSAIVMGRRLKQLEGRVHQAEHSAVMPNIDEAKFAQASRLVKLGASASDLVDSCGVARGEAELLVSMKRRAS